MAVFALINAGMVIETGQIAFPVAAPLVWTPDISTIAPQPLVGWTAAQTGGLWAYTAPPSAPLLTPTLAQQAVAAIGSGVTIALSGSTTLAPTTFPTDPTTQTKLDSVITVVTATGKFPGGETLWPMKDAVGNWHTFTIGQYTTIAAAIAGYVAPLDLIQDGNTGVTALPSPDLSLVV